MDRRRILLVAAALVAALGTVLVLMYARGADARAEERFETVEVLRATAQIEAGEPLDEALDAARITTVDVVAGERLDSALDDRSALSDQVALQTIYPGEQVIAEKVGPTAATGPTLLIPASGELAISVNLTDPSRVAGFVRPGSEVSVFVTTMSFTRLLLDRVSVLGVGSTTPVSTTAEEDEGDGTEVLPRTLITLSLTQKQAERVLFAQSIGDLSVGLLTDKSSVKPGGPTSLANLFG